MTGQRDGGNTEQSGMTKPWPWPENEREHRDGAAERINDASVILDKIVGNGLNTHLPVEAIIMLYQAQRLILDALRLLERAGAQTTPKER